MTAYVYNLDTNNVHAVFVGEKATEAATELALGGGDEYAVTHSPAFGTNDGLVMCEDTNEYDTDAPDFDVTECEL
jgi:hypothetical protein